MAKRMLFPRTELTSYEGSFVDHSFGSETLQGEPQNWRKDLVWDYAVRPKDAIHLATAMEAQISLIETFDEGFIGKSGQVGSPTILIRKPLPALQRKLL